jgi:hypothetical protein
MATTMSMAQGSVEVGLPPEKVREKWTQWTKEGAPGNAISGGQSQKVSAEQLPEELRNSEAGMAHFDKGVKGGTSVRMELRYNPQGLEKAGKDHEWIEKRIELYLTRFKNFAEGHSA